ncbi:MULTISPECIES: hypothetical protein [unclassified Janthinobacterium]|uniref:hypothetical protein n=1 Tax=unclassified Janthinobacterium TaxID=2610881 RepID=UPI001610F86E|nr:MULTISPECIES: hypothetical protein [unclassified Janthinobacterium]MBB5610555.1 hypothetical protein [Janthinobacterium sp. S3T4]MBB5615991.1 hypothetical protein [Janthinobacterium sp. S3M3]
MATPITWVNYQSGGSVYVQFADGRGRLKYGSASPGDFFLEHPGGETELMSKHDFERRYEVCDPDLRPQFHPMPPADVIAAAHLVDRYFAKQNIDQWELGPCMSRFPRAELQIKLAVNDHGPRGLFEQTILYGGHGSVDRHPGGRYRNRDVECAWQGWNARPIPRRVLDSSTATAKGASA